MRNSKKWVCVMRLNIGAKFYRTLFKDSKVDELNGEAMQASDPAAILLSVRFYVISET